MSTIGEQRHGRNHGRIGRDLAVGVGWLLASLSAGPVSADPAQVLAYQKINDAHGGFTGGIDDGSSFGYSLASLGDLDGDGVTDVVVGAPNHGPIPPRGAVWFLFLNEDGTVKAHQEIGEGAGGFGGPVENFDRFGQSVAGIGDLDDDGIVDLAVGVIGDDPGGAVWILLLNADGTVSSEQKIDESSGGFTGTIDAGDGFGHSLAGLGDLDGDGVEDLAVGAGTDDDGGSTRGGVWILFLNADGTVKTHQKISDTEGGFTGNLDNNDVFGGSLALFESGSGVDPGGGVVTLAVGAGGDDDGGYNRGAVWLLALTASGTVASHQKISDTAGGFAGVIDDSDNLGIATAVIGDLDENGALDLAVGARDDDGGEDRGAVWILFLNADGTVATHQKISSTEGSFDGALTDSDLFGRSIAWLGDQNGDGIGDMVAGAPSDSESGPGRGAVWMLFLGGPAPPECPADINESGTVGFDDLTTLLTDWGWGPCIDDCRSDVDGDGSVGFGDLVLMLGAWGPCPEAE